MSAGAKIRDYDCIISFYYVYEVGVDSSYLRHIDSSGLRRGFICHTGLAHVVHRWVFTKDDLRSVWKAIKSKDGYSATMNDVNDSDECVAPNEGLTIWVKKPCLCMLTIVVCMFKGDCFAHIVEGCMILCAAETPISKNAPQVHWHPSAKGNLKQSYWWPCSVSIGVIPQQLHLVAEK